MSEILNMNDVLTLCPSFSNGPQADHRGLTPTRSWRRQTSRSAIRPFSSPSTRIYGISKSIWRSKSSCWQCCRPFCRVRMLHPILQRTVNETLSQTCSSSYAPARCMPSSGVYKVFTSWHTSACLTARVDAREKSALLRSCSCWPCCSCSPRRH